jgi:hypothetical protein
MKQRVLPHAIAQAKNLFCESRSDRNDGSIWAFVSLPDTLDVRDQTQEISNEERKRWHGSRR